MHYFIPFWPGDDIYEEFDPWTDLYSGRQKRIWECFDKPPFNGILVSRVNIEHTNNLRKKAEKEGIHSALGFYGQIIGDCGAFSYVSHAKPPYDPISTLSFYKKLGFDIGVTVDHLIVKTIKNADKTVRTLTEAEREDRWNLTIENAKKMFDEAKKSDYEKMRLIGASQGWDAESYAKGVRELLTHGFDYIGLGGLARKPTLAIKKILLQVHKEVRENLKNRRVRGSPGPKVGIHLFGVARPDLFAAMVQCGITSFDSASPLRTAWASADKNYMLNEHFYSAVRIREAKNENEKAREKEIFESLRQFSQGRMSSSDFLDRLSQYDLGISHTRKENVLRTLENRPWEKCDCPICAEMGLHVCIFRGCERNMRRGFHNVYQFGKLLRQKYPRILALTWCTRGKSAEEELMPAYKRYSASKIFRTFWENVHELPVEIGILSARYMMINWDTRIPMYEERLGAGKVTEAVKDLENKFRFYDKVFFIGLGLYREAVKKAAENVSTPVEIYPREDLSRGKLDIIEYNRQIKNFAEAIRREITSYLETMASCRQTELNAF